MTGTWFTGWATGDIVTAAEFRKGAGSIFDTTLGASAATIDIPSIPQTYAHLLVVLYGRCDTAGTSVGCAVRMNNDASFNYDSQTLLANAAIASAGENFAVNLAYCTMPAASAPANLFGISQLLIPHYANAANQKATISLSGAKWGTASTNLFVHITSGAWRSTAAINRLTFLPTSGNFVAGTRLTIYALGA